MAACCSSSCNFLRILWFTKTQQEPWMQHLMLNRGIAAQTSHRPKRDHHRLSDSMGGQHLSGTLSAIYGSKQVFALSFFLHEFYSWKMVDITIFNSFFWDNLGCAFHLVDITRNNISVLFLTVVRGTHTDWTECSMPLNKPFSPYGLPTATSIFLATLWAPQLTM